MSHNKTVRNGAFARPQKVMEFMLLILFGNTGLSCEFITWLITKPQL